MTQYLLLFWAFILFTGMAIGLARLFHMQMAEGLVLAAALISLVMGVSGWAQHFEIGVGLLIAIGIAGWAWQILGTARGSAAATGTAATGQRRTATSAAKTVSANAVTASVSTGTAPATRYLRTPAFIFAALMLAGSSIIYFNDTIQHIDELHMWALAVKYMMEKGRLPYFSDYVGTANRCNASCCFNLFFQKITGYNEGFMYATMALLVWIGFWLPFAHRRMQSRDGVRKQAALTLILYLGIYSLYLYGTKNLYVDLLSAAWSFGLAGWWISREGRKTDYLLALAVLAFLFRAKANVGLLMAVITLLFLIVCEFAEGRRQLPRALTPPWTRSKILKMITGLIGAGIALAVIFFVSCAIRYHGVSAFISSALTNVRPKIKMVIGAYVTAIFGRPLARISDLQIALPVVVLLVIILHGLTMWLESVQVRGAHTDEAADPAAGSAADGAVSNAYNRDASDAPAAQTTRTALTAAAPACIPVRARTKNIAYLVYYGVALLFYLATLLMAYLFIFSYEESITARSCQRYFSIILIYLLSLALLRLLRACPGTAGAAARNVTATTTITGSAATAAANTPAAGHIPQPTRIVNFALLGLLFFFTLGLNVYYIPNATAANLGKVEGYYDIRETKRQLKLLTPYLEEDDRVYMINQAGENEMPTNTAIYYLETQVSNYAKTPWKFTEIGSITRLKESDESTIEDFPQILADGSYTYVWIYETDEYLDEHLPEVLETDGGLTAPGLYQVICEDGEATGLELVIELGEAEEEEADTDDN